MKAFQCDICSSFYNVNAANPSPRTDPFTEGPLTFDRKVLIVADQNTNKMVAHDVCPTCMSALQRVCRRINKEGGSEWLK